MNVFLTGGTGALGRPVLRLLTERGHVVRVLAQDERRDEIVRELGAEPVRADLFDPASLERAVDGSEAVLHLATRIPAGRPAGEPASWAENDRIRAEGTRNLVDAALTAGASVFVYPSVVFVYPESGDAWIDAGGTPTDATGPIPSTLEAEAEVARFTAGGRRGVVLRMGGFIGPTAGTSVQLLEAARHGYSALPGRDRDYQSWIWVDDAAAAVLAGLERAPAGVYDVVDDRPLTRAELERALAEVAGREQALARPDGPVSPVASALSRSLRVSNRRLKQATGWAPAVGDAAEGFRRLASGEDAS